MATTLYDPLDARFRAAAQPHSASTRLSRKVLLSAAALGVVGDALLRDGPLGIGFTLFVAALLYALARLARTREVRWTLGATLLLIPIAITASAFTARASGTLLFYNLLGLLAALSALAWALLRGDAWEPGNAGVGAYLAGFAKSGLSAAVGGFPLVADARVGELARGGAREGGLRHWPAILRAALLTVPILLVFGALFSSADPVFDHLVRNVLDIDVGVLLSHVFVAGVLAWPSAGYLRSAIVAPIDERMTHRDESTFKLGVIEIGSALGALNALFLLFVAVQLRYLFGGAALVQATAHMTYAEYARRGFFELVWVTAFALGTLIAANGALRRERARDEWIFRGLAWSLLVLLAVVMLSAVQRMRLYQSEYGLTETRFYATVCMAWLGVLLAWFGATVLRGRGTPAFAFGAIVSAWVAVAALDVANPDAIIARTNMARLNGGMRFDASYIRRLSADAVPTVARALESPLPSLSANDRCWLEQFVVKSRVEAPRSWRVWNAARAGAVDTGNRPRFAGVAKLDCGLPPRSAAASGAG